MELKIKGKEKAVRSIAKILREEGIDVVEVSMSKAEKHSKKLEEIQGKIREKEENETVETAGEEMYEPKTTERKSWMYQKNKEVAKELEEIKDKTEEIIEKASLGLDRINIIQEIIGIKNGIKEKKEFKTLHTANGDLTTAELCSELQNREGVNHMMIDPYAVKEVIIKVEGPARVFIVYD